MKVYEGKIDIEKIAEGSLILPQDVKRFFSDGRLASRWAETWASRIYQKTEARVNQSDFDLIGRKDSEYSVKCLTQHGAHFACSKRRGAGRSSVPADIKKDIRAVEAFIVVDVRQIPTVRFVKFTSAEVMEWFVDFVMGRDGHLIPAKFDELCRGATVTPVNLLTGKEK